jgi:hypothetical protein
MSYWVMRQSGRRDVVDVIVVEFDGLDHGLSAGGRDPVDEGDDAFAPLLNVDVFGISARLHRRLRRCLGSLDRIGVGFGFTVKPS